MIRYITVDCTARIYEIEGMWDCHGKPTQDPALAASCVIKVDDCFIEQDAEHIPIYTVH